jgi:hypothetical protein
MGMAIEFYIYSSITRHRYHTLILLTYLSSFTFNRWEGVVFLDGISLLEASLIYSLLFSPILTMVLLLFWASVNMKTIAKAQLFGIIILFALGFLAINSPIILIVEAVAIILLVVWIFAYRDFFHKEQLPVILPISALQIAYYILFFVFMGLKYNLITLLIIPILSMILLYPWTFGNKKTSKGQVLIMIIFIVQGIYAILVIVLSLMAMSNL